MITILWIIWSKLWWLILLLYKPRVGLGIDIGDLRLLRRRFPGVRAQHEIRRKQNLEGPIKNNFVFGRISKYLSNKQRGYRFISTIVVAIDATRKRHYQLYYLLYRCRLKLFNQSPETYDFNGENRILYIRN